MNITCPLPAALTAIPASTCPFIFGQIVRIAFQQRQTESTFTDLTDFQDKDTWTTLKAASDATKIVMSPVFAGFTIPSSEALTQGGNDNSTLNGMPEYYGEGFVQPTGIFKNLQPAAKKAMLDMVQFSLMNAAGASNLTWYLFNKDNYAFYIDNGGIFGAEVYNYRVGSAGGEGLNSPNQTPFSGTMGGEWDNNLKSVKMPFNVLTEL